MIAALGFNRELDRRDLIQRWCKVDESIEPDRDLTSLYECRFREYAETRRIDHAGRG